VVRLGDEHSKQFQLARETRSRQATEWPTRKQHIARLLLNFHYATIDSGSRAAIQISGDGFADYRMQAMADYDPWSPTPDKGEAAPARRMASVFGNAVYRVYNYAAIVVTSFPLFSFFSKLYVYRIWLVAWHSVHDFFAKFLPAFFSEVLLFISGGISQFVQVYHDFSCSLICAIGLDIPPLWRDILFISTISIGWGIRRALITPSKVWVKREQEVVKTRRVPIDRTWAEWWEGKPNYKYEDYTVIESVDTQVSNFIGVLRAGALRFMVVAVALMTIFLMDYIYRMQILSLVSQEVQIVERKAQCECKPSE